MSKKKAIYSWNGTEFEPQAEFIPIPINPSWGGGGGCFYESMGQWT